MLSRLSIRARLTIAFASAVVVVLVLAGAFIYLLVSGELSTNLDNSVRSRTDNLASLVADSGARPPALRRELLEGEEGFSEILRPDGSVVSSTLPPGSGPQLSGSELTRAAGGTLTIDARDVPGVEGAARIVAQPVATPGGTLVVVAGSSTDDRSEALAGLLHSFLIGGPIALLVASGAGYLLAGRALRPVEAMRRRAAEITLERSGERLPLPAADDEIHRLGETLNTMLDRIEASLDRERVFVADASHELRTPLAILRSELELAARQERSPAELREAIDSASEEVERLSRLAEDLLVIARSDQGRLPIKREEVELGELLERVRDRFAPRLAEAERELAIQAPPGAEASLDPLRAEQALGNLVDNALRHGEGEIRLSARQEGDGAVFEVSDEGPGFPQGFEHLAFERFSRADGGRTGGGAGLGLSIVRVIAEAHGGDAVADGSRVTITLPAASPHLPLTGG